MGFNLAWIPKITGRVKGFDVSGDARQEMKHGISSVQSLAEAC